MDTSLWYPLLDFAVPARLFKSGKPVLTFAELSVFIFACSQAKEPLLNCCCELPLEQTQAVIGYGESQVLTAVRGLQDKQFIRHQGGQNREDTGRFGSQSFELLDSEGDGLSASGRSRRNFVSLRSALYRRKQPYFSIPVCVIGYLSNLTGAALAVYVAAVRLCNLAGKREITVPVSELRSLAGIARNETLREALDALQPTDGKLLETALQRRDVHITLLNPLDGMPLEYSEIIGAETGKAVTRKEYSDDLLLLWACAMIWKTTSDVLREGSDGDFLGHCPMCRGANARRKGTRTLSINVMKRSTRNPYGIYWCHSCRAGEGETLLDLVMRCSGMTAIKSMTELEKLKAVGA